MRYKMYYSDVARDHTRAEFLRRVAQGWELPVPVSISGIPIPDSPGISSETDAIVVVETKLKTFILPSVEFVDTPLRDALEFLQQRSVELDVNEPDITKKGINFVLRGVSGGGGGAAVPPAGGGGGLGFDGAGAGGAGFSGGAGEARITLRLSNVPLLEALRYTTELAQLKYKIEPRAVPKWLSPTGNSKLRHLHYVARRAGGHVRSLQNQQAGSALQGRRERKLTVRIRPHDFDDL